MTGRGRGTWRETGWVLAGCWAMCGLGGALMLGASVAVLGFTVIAQARAVRARRPHA